MFKDLLMKYKNKFSINLYFFATLIILILFLKSIDFFKKIYSINYEDHELRQQQAYDFCENSGTGYISYIKKNFNLKNMPDIKNFHRVPNQNWIFHASKKQFSKNEKQVSHLGLCIKGSCHWFFVSYWFYCLLCISFF